jgi:kinesin family protein C2/C3
VFLETERPVIFVNAGGGAIKKEGGINLDIEKDCCFEGGDVIRTDESIINGGDIPSVYQSARFGTNLSYKFNDMPAGEYLVDLHFAEIVYTNGPKGMRVFDVFIQEEKASALSPLSLSSLFFFNEFICFKTRKFFFKIK